MGTCSLKNQIRALVFAGGIFILPFLAQSAQETTLTPQADLSRSLNPHWHQPYVEIIQTPAVPRPVLTPNFRPSENKLLYTKLDPLTRCDQIYLFDLDENREVRLTDSCLDYDTDGFTEGGKMDPSWGVYLTQVPMSAGSNAPLVSGWTIVYAYNDGEYKLDDGTCGNPGCSIFIKMIGSDLRASALENTVGLYPEIRLTRPRYGNNDAASGRTHDRKPVMNFRPSASNELTIAFVRYNDPASAYREMIYSINFNAAQLYTISTAPRRYGQPVAGVTENNLTYRYSGNCQNPDLPAFDFNDPQWFPDGLNLAFSVAVEQNGARFSQIGTLHRDERQIAGTPASPSRVYSCGAEASATGDTTSLRIHTLSPRHHELPMPSLPLIPVAGSSSAEYGIVYQVREGGNDRSMVGGFTVIRDQLGVGNSLISLTPGAGAGQIVSAHTEETLDFQDAFSRRRPVWSAAIAQRRAWIGYERQEADGTWNIYGTQLLLEPAPAIQRQRFPGQPITPIQQPIGIDIGRARIGALQIGMPNTETLEYRWTSCPDNHYWPEFRPVFTVNADGSITLPASTPNIAYGKAVGNPESDHQITHLFNLPQPADLRQCAAIPPVREDTCSSNADSSPLADDADGDGLRDACDNILDASSATDPLPTETPGRCLAVGPSLEDLDRPSIADVLRSRVAPVSRKKNGEPARTDDGQEIVMINGRTVTNCSEDVSAAKFKGSSFFGSVSLIELMVLFLAYGMIRSNRFRIQ